jgi:hypothetical protein
MLTLATRNLEAKWAETRFSWRDRKAAEFEETYLTAQAQGHHSQLLAHGETRGCGPGGRRRAMISVRIMSRTILLASGFWPLLSRRPRHGR